MNPPPLPIIESEGIQEYILEVLEKRFGADATQTFKPALDAIDDSERLEQLLHTACHVNRVEDFRQALGADGSTEQPNAVTLRRLFTRKH